MNFKIILGRYYNNTKRKQEKVKVLKKKNIFNAKIPSCYPKFSVETQKFVTRHPVYEAGARQYFDNDT